MEEKIERKMTEVVEYILTKPKETITADEYMILASEKKDLRFRREQAEQGDRMGQLLSAVFPGFGGPDVVPVKESAKSPVKAPVRTVKK